MPTAATVSRTAALGRLGVDLVRARLSTAGPAHDAARRLVSQRLGRLRGLPQKIGQILSLGDVDDDAPFAALTEAAEPVPSDQSFAWIARELGAPVGDVFRCLDSRGIAASIGQVHRGQLHDGRTVAVKVRFPDITDAIEADLAALGWLAAPLTAGRSGFDLSAYRAEMRRNLLRELDYRGEAETLARFAGRANEIPGLVTPVPVPEFSTHSLIVMSWVDGTRLSHTAAWPEQARRAAARILLQLFLRGCFVWRELHADPHAGNIRFERLDDDARVGVIDFGAVATLTEAESRALWDLATNAPTLSNRALLDRYVSLGFDPDLLAPMTGRLGAVTASLFEPFATKGPYDVRQWRLSERLAAALGEDRWNFRCAGPASMVPLIRAVHGLMYYTRALGVALDWRGELEATGLTDAGADIGEAAPTLAPGDDHHMQASTLRLRVTRDGVPVVQLTCRATVVAHLPDLIPEEQRDRVRSHGIDVAALARSTMDAGYPPGELFSVDDGNKTVRVWLE